MKKYIILLGGLLTLSSFIHAQTDIYIGPTTSMVTFPNAQMTIFGNIINDGVATPSSLTSGGATGLNHNGGGTVYLFRATANGTGSSEIKDGPSAPSFTGNYNDGGACVRIFNLITDNTVGTNTPSGTEVNTTSGNGQINLRQEVRVTNTLTLNNGMIWTPRGEWRHAYVHLEGDAASVSGVTPNSQFTAPGTTPHIDGYVAKSGGGNFDFPVGDGIYSRYCSIITPDTGIYKAAYFHKSAMSLTTASGISGSTTQGNVENRNDSLVGIGTKEFWDIDGTGITRISLDALNTVSGYSDWVNDQGVGASGRDFNEIVISALDDWENLRIDTNQLPGSFSLDGRFPSIYFVNPDTGMPATGSDDFLVGTGNPFVAFTWGVDNLGTVGLDLIQFQAVNSNCKPVLSWTVIKSVDHSFVKVQRSADQNVWKNVAMIPAPDMNTEQNFLWVDENAHNGDEYFYRLEYTDLNYEKKYSDLEHVKLSCSSSDPWTIFPNPASSEVNIVGETDAESIRVVLTDVYGKLISWQIESPSNQYLNAKVSLTNLPLGSYFVQLLDNSSGETLKSQQVMKF